MNSAYRVTLALAAVGAAVVSVPAAAVTPVSAVGSSSYPGYDASFAIDQGAGSATTDWASNGMGVGSYLNLNLGAVYSLNSFSLVDRVTSGGGNGSFVGGTTDFTTSFSLGFYSDASFSNRVATYTFSKVTPSSPTTPSSFAFSGSLAGSPATQYVRYTVLAANGPNPGLSNITFGAVPEPASWAMMIAGFGLVGGAMRTRRKVALRFA